MAENLLDLAVCIEKKIKEEEDLKHLVYTERDYLGRNALTIASSERFYAILENSLIGTIVKKLWEGDIQNNGVWPASSIHKSCHYNPATIESLQFLYGIDRSIPY